MKKQYKKTITDRSETRNETRNYYRELPKSVIIPKSQKENTDGFEGIPEITVDET